MAATVAGTAADVNAWRGAGFGFPGAARRGYDCGVTMPGQAQRLQAEGKFFRLGDARVWLRAVTYGPFPGGWPADFGPDFRRIAAAGFHALWIYEMPDRRLLDAAAAAGLRVIAGLKWRHQGDFLHEPALLAAARDRLVSALRATADHPALAAVLVANEIPADLVRWMGPVRVRRALEDLIETGRRAAPHLLFAYANYPTTEYLEPDNADFSAFNIYLENAAAFRSYLKRLHHIAGDRPLLVSEFGLDSRRHGLQRQAETLQWAMEIARAEECAGMAIYAWSDRWWNRGAEVDDWDFGLTDRAGHSKPALAAAAAAGTSDDFPAASFSVIVCTRNGRDRIDRCLHAIRLLEGGPYETVVVDDGSDDGTADMVAAAFPWVKLLRLPASGLAAARNAGAAMAGGDFLAFTDDDCVPDREWLLRLGRVLRHGGFAAAGGPNLPPPPQSWREAVVAAAPGAPSHVLLDDEEAEHLPGCNFAVSKTAFAAIGGFDPQFHTAGDDVDFCWRLRDAGFRLGFAPGAFVWHRRRTTLCGFLRQQYGYGVAESLLLRKFPARFSPRGGAIWEGFVYGGGPVRVAEGSFIDHGPMGAAGYQSVVNRMLPLRPLAGAFNHRRARAALAIITWLAPVLRAWNRCREIPEVFPFPSCPSLPAQSHHQYEIAGVACDEVLRRMLADAWAPAGATDEWDVEKDGTRVLVATAHGEAGEPLTMLRVWGGPLPRCLCGKSGLPSARRME